jgi:cysteine rich repeat protein
MQQVAARSRRASMLCLGALVFAALTASAGAQITSAQQSAIRSNCRSDFQSHCSGVTPGGKDALACLQNNVAKLSASCQTAVRATLPKAPAQAVAPPAAPSPAPAAAAAPPQAAPEKSATIVSAPPPKAQPVKRPIKHPAEAAVTPVQPAPIAAAPAAQAGPTPSQQNAMRQNCRNDFMSKCSGVQPGGKEALACLQQNVTGLSAACKRVVSATMKGAPPAAPTMAQPAAAATPAMVPGGVLVEKACARYILMNCRGTGLGTGPKVACMVNYVNAGNFVGPRCRAALNVTGQLR